MGVDRAVERKNKRKELAKLRDAALTELERRGYEVRGKTPAQIRELLKRRPNKSLSVKLRAQTSSGRPMSAFGSKAELGHDAMSDNDP